MQLQLFFFLGLVMNASSYLLQNKPQILSTSRLQHSIQNNMLHPNNSNKTGTKNKNLVLDVNCQTGETTRKLEDIFFNYKVIGFDKDETNIEIAKKNFPKSEFSCVDFDCTIFPYLSMKESCFFININSYKELDVTLLKCHFLLQPEGKLMIPYRGKSLNPIYNALESYGLENKFQIKRHEKLIEFVKK